MGGCWYLGDKGTKEVGRDPGYEAQKKLGLGDQLLAIELPDSKARYHTNHLLAMTLLSPLRDLAQGMSPMGPGERGRPGHGALPLLQCPRADHLNQPTDPPCLHEAPSSLLRNRWKGCCAANRRWKPSTKKPPTGIGPGCAEPVASQAPASKEGFLEAS